MLLKFVSVAICAAIFSVGAANAQTLKQINGPSEPPPAGFKGQMFVDSKGCVFLRAGYGGNVTWVPRVNSAHKVLCGYPPTVAAMAVPVEVEDAPVLAAVPPAPKATGKPLDTVASLSTPPKIRAGGAAPMRASVAPVVAAKPAVPVILPSATSGRKIGCYVSAPVPKLVALRTGGTAVLCTRGDGTLEGARAPIYAVVAQGLGNRVGAGLYSGGAVSARQVQVSAVDAPIVVPKGYKLAWSDDRLNPNRARGTAKGQAAQDRVWTQDVPATLVAVGPARVVKVVRKGHVVVSTMNAAPTPRAMASGAIYVQIGTFGVQSNADGAKARLRAAGMPVGSANITKAGKPLQIVLAGPFGDSRQAQAALAAVQGAGFGDAFIR